MKLLKFKHCVQSLHIATHIHRPIWMTCTKNTASKHRPRGILRGVLERTSLAQSTGTETDKSQTNSGPLFQNLLCNLKTQRSGGSSVSLVTRIRDHYLGSILSGAGIFSSLLNPDRLWGPPSFPFNGYWGYSGRNVKMTTHLHLVSRLRMCRDTHLFPQQVFMAWRLSKHRIRLHSVVLS
jgi:hypothetical protein